jgi:hypothetical protein
VHGPGLDGRAQAAPDPAGQPGPGRSHDDRDQSAFDRVEQVLSHTPLRGKAFNLRVAGSIAEGLDYLVAIPVCNEEALLPRALVAIERAMAGAKSRSGAVVIVINDSRDRSARLALDWADRVAVPHQIVEADFHPSVRDAPHARRLALDLAAGFAAEGTLFTTDADSHVGPDWIREGLAHVAAGADLVCEDVRLDETEAARLPDRVRLVGEVERAYFEASEVLWRKWTDARAGSFAYRASGASLVIRTAAYLEVGRLPLPAHGEDQALCEAMLRRGLKIETNRNGATRTSARLVARARGGCASALADRALMPDPLCDPALVPLAELRRRAAAASRPGAQREDHDTASPALRFTQVLRELADAIDLLEEGP